MRLSLSAKWFLWLSAVVAAFCVIQTLGMLWLEVSEVMSGRETLSAEFSEIAVLLTVSGCVFVLMLGGFWFVSRRMIRPISTIAETANRISEGELDERVEGAAATDEIGMLATALNRAFDRYRDVLQQLDRFTGNAAHQLRTPLASIRSIGEVCLQKERSAPEYGQAVESMLEVARELADIVEKLLMIARLNPKRAQQTFAPLVMVPVVDRLLDLYVETLQAKRIQLQRNMEATLLVTGDAALISSAIGNVIDNAVKFTPEGGEMSVSLQGKDRNIVLTVRDTGPGIPRGVRSALTRDSACLVRGGELPTGGLGLAIVSEIMRVHGGSLVICSGDDGGSGVSLVWPRSG